MSYTTTTFGGVDAPDARTAIIVVDNSAWIHLEVGSAQLAIWPENSSTRTLCDNLEALTLWLTDTLAAVDAKRDEVRS